MERETLVLVVHQDVNMLHQLQPVLRPQRIHAWYAGNCEVARSFLAGTVLPDVVFTGPAFPDGTWHDVLAAARTIAPHLAVVLMTRIDDAKLYLEAMDEGAFDYIIPSFASGDVSRIVESAGVQKMCREGNSARPLRA